MPLCTLIVCSRDKAQHIADNLLLVDRDCTHRFADAFPFAWVHAADDFEVFFGAVGKPEPALLFTNRISLARELLFEDFDYRKRVSAVVLHDIDPNAVPITELHDIKEQINRRKNGSLITLQSVGKVSEAMNAIIDEKVKNRFLVKRCFTFNNRRLVS